jgi:hypothetical protein
MRDWRVTVDVGMCNPVFMIELGGGMHWNAWWRYKSLYEAEAMKQDPVELGRDKVN